MKKILVLAIFLRLILAAFYFHPDIKTYNFQASFFKKGVFNIYEYLTEHKKDLPLKEEFVYFPLAYFVTGGYQLVVSPILGLQFDSWVGSADSNLTVRDSSIFKYLTVLKLPYLILDILIAFILMKFFEKQEDKRKAFIIWLFNPFTIILIYVFSNIDMYPVLLTLLSFLLLKKEKLYLGSVLLGLASGFKLYPLLFTPFLFAFGKDIKEKVLASIISLMIFALISIPFTSTAFVDSALVSGLSTGIFRSNLTSIGVSLLFFYSLVLDRKINLFNYWLALFMIIFSFSLFHIQWLLWIAPFIIIFLVKNPTLTWATIFLAVVAFAIPVFYEDRFMTVGLLRVYSTFYDLIPTPFVVIQKFYDPGNLRDVLHSVLAGGSLILIYKIFRKEVQHE